MANLEQKVKIIKIEKDLITAEFVAHSSCANCSAKHMCSMSECTKKTVQITDENADEFKLGQEVFAIINEKNAFYAVAFAYVIPLVILLVSLIGCNYVTKCELKSGVCSIIILITYYLLLIFCNKYFNKKLRIKIKREC